MKREVDLIVVGAGPGGSWAAKHAAKAGLSVLLLEKDREVGVPVRCAEGVSEKGLRSVISIDTRWIAQVIRGVRFIAPDGTKVDAYPGETGYILNRKLFDAALAEEACQSGAHLYTKANVTGLLMENGRTRGVRLRHIGEEKEIRCSIVIGADGIESRIGRWGGLNTAIAWTEMAACAQMTCCNIDIEPERVELYMGREIAPGGYAWVFPKGPRSANVGLGISGAFNPDKKALDYLKDFVSRRFPNAFAMTIVAGGVPIGRPLRDIVSDGLMLVGDAGRQTNPMSGGGIVNAMIAGELAAKTAAAAIKQGDVSVRKLRAYARDWTREEGRNNYLSYKFKEVISGFSDEDINQTARMLLKIPVEKRNAFNVFKAALIRHPKLVLEARKVFL